MTVPKLVHNTEEIVRYSDSVAFHTQDPHCNGSTIRAKKTFLRKGMVVGEGFFPVQILIS